MSLRISIELMPYECWYISSELQANKSSIKHWIILKLRATLALGIIESKEIIDQSLSIDLVLVKT